jgi:lauroyl/myristoyl acyltransferase
MKFFTKNMWEDFCLNLYLGVGLELAAYTGKSAYWFVNKTGHFFRSWDVFASTLGKRGVLNEAQKNIKMAEVVMPGTEKIIIRDYLKFESRFALENIWIRKKAKKFIKGAFEPDHINKLQKMLENRQFIIATPHTSALYVFVSLVKTLGHDAPFVVMNPLAVPIKNPAPFQRILLRLFPKWSEANEFVFMQDNNVFERCKKVLQSGRSLIIAPDTPFQSTKNVPVEFLGRKTGVAPGIAVLSEKCKVDVLAVSHWAENSSRPYKLDMRIINSKGVSQCMEDIFQFFQTAIERNPACWNGWLYWEQMDHKEVMHGKT